MQRIIQINIAGRVIPIEEDAYLLLKDYLGALHRQFAHEPGAADMIQDFESRIAELFLIRLQSGAPAIDRADVAKVISTMGAASDIGSSAGEPIGSSPYLPATYVKPRRRLYRDPNDRVIGGVCSGLAHYMDIDPTVVRIVWAALFLFGGIGGLLYIIAWIAIPAARTPQQVAEMADGSPLTMANFQGSMNAEFSDLKRRGEQMSRELKDFFSRKK